MPRGAGRIAITLAFVLVVVGVSTVALHPFVARSTGARPATTTALPRTTTSSTTTTTPAGVLPQTTVLPPARNPGLTLRMTALLRAVATGQPRLAYGAFFPIGAYVQTKTGSNNAEDWHVRLLGHFDEDVATLHAELGAHHEAPRLIGYSVDDPAAVWVVPGVEENKGPYWRVYDTTVTYAIGRQQGSFTVTTMISWRGSWYVVHLIGFNS